MGSSGRRSSSSGSGGSHGSGGSSKGKMILVIAAVVIFMIVSKGGGPGDTSVGSYSDSYGDVDSYNGYDDSYGSGSGYSVNTQVSGQARAKYTEILGGKKDVTTLMIYMCGTDLESKNGFASRDLKEMLNADLNDSINLIVYTGGCKNWSNSSISGSRNQIFQIRKGKLICLEDDMGNASMTKASTLTDFITYCTKNFPANRNQLILWDHGGGTISGYGYDELHSGSGSMKLSDIDTALRNAGTTFDFIGFDACLMATMENALMLTRYADYLIASEETEPGIGWYYTNWLNKYAKNPSMPTVELSKIIIDDFVDTCARSCSGQKATLSVVDLAELQETVPQSFRDFSQSTCELIRNMEYDKVSAARNNTREFAVSSKIDQVDLVHLAQNMKTEQGDNLSRVIQSAVKYNRTSSNMTHAGGLSIFFPYKKVSKVDDVVATYEKIGLDEEYARCIQDFASMEVSGQVSTGSQGSGYDQISGSGYGGQGATGGDIDLIGDMLGDLFSGNGSLFNLGEMGLNFFSGRDMNQENMSTYLSQNYFRAEDLAWKQEGNLYKLCLSEQQWKQVYKLDLNVFYDDGSGYVDLGYDNLYDFDENGNLIGNFGGTWLSINRQPVAYYHTDTIEDGDRYTISGFVPCMLNGVRSELILNFDQDRPNGYIAGARTVYKGGETETVAKSLTEVKSGDRIDFLCDYYSYDGTYNDTYYLGQTMTLSDEVLIGDADIDASKAKVTYRITDQYQKCYFTPVVPGV